MTVGSLRSDHFATIEGGFIPGVGVPPAFADTCGDLNGDDTVDVSDAIILLQIVVGLVDPSSIQQTLGDLNRDGDIDVSDAIITLQVIVGLTEITECGPSAS